MRLRFDQSPNVLLSKSQRSGHFGPHVVVAVDVGPKFAHHSVRGRAAVPVLQNVEQRGCAHYRVACKQYRAKSALTFCDAQ